MRAWVFLSSSHRAHKAVVPAGRRVQAHGCLPLPVSLVTLLCPGGGGPGAKFALWIHGSSVLGELAPERVDRACRWCTSADSRPAAACSQSWASQRQMMADLQLKWLQATLNASTADWIIVAGYGGCFGRCACHWSAMRESGVEGSGRKSIRA